MVKNLFLQKNHSFLVFFSWVQQWYKEEIVRKTSFFCFVFDCFYFLLFFLPIWAIEFQVERKNAIPKPLVKKLGQVSLCHVVSSSQVMVHPYSKNYALPFWGTQSNFSIVPKSRKKDSHVTNLLKF